MDLQELLNLIAIRNYVVNSVANPVFDRKTVKDLDGLLILLDKKIANLLLSSEFKEYVNFAALSDTLKEVVGTNNQAFTEARQIMQEGRKQMINSGIVTQKK